MGKCLVRDFKETDEEINLMTDKKFVKTIIPTAKCSTLDKSPMGAGPAYSEDHPMYVVYALDSHKPARYYIVGFSMISGDRAWAQVAETFRQKMLSVLESATA